MKYRIDKYGNKLSVLGYGCMRFPTKNGRIDISETEKQILFAIEQGINYFDTAYIYPGSEAALGEILHRNGLRDRVYIATKLPHYLVKSREAMDRILEEELTRLKTDRIDYYFMHMLTNADAFSRLCSLGLKEWIAEKKAKGQINQVGFSYHGNTPEFIKLCDAYQWDFCMIQYNYMDEHSQAGRRGLEYAASKNMPVMIMEPLRGGRLVSNLPEKAKEIFRNHTPSYSPALWAFKWLWDQPEVSVVLSGMNTVWMIAENAKAADEAQTGELSENDREMLQSVVSAINEKMKVGCTGCGYCMPCPMGVDIPGTFAAYNRRFCERRFVALKEYFMCTALRKNSASASSCIGCRKCEKHCPQSLEIAKELKNASKTLEGPIFRLGCKLAKIFVKF